MAEKAFNLKSATFGAQVLGFPVNARSDSRGDTENDSTGLDGFIADQRLVRRKIFVQISFNDFDDAQAMQNAQVGTEATLKFVVPDTTEPTAVNKEATILRCLCTGVSIDTQHAEFGSHIASFESRAGDGSTNPISWANEP